MLPVLTSSAMRALDRRLIDEVGIPSLVLMENAAKGALEAIEDWIRAVEHPIVLIFAGTGNNGGDGLALARLLAARQVYFRILLVGEKARMSPDARWQLEELERLGLGDHVYPFSESTIELTADTPTILVDALVGTGRGGELREPIRGAVLALNTLAHDRRASVLALDIPTGLDADTGEFGLLNTGQPLAVKATRTVTFGALKLGFYQEHARLLVGELRIASLGTSLDNFADTDVSLVEPSDILRHYPTRPDWASKFTMGRVLVVCGSRGMTGAAIMVGEAALRAGCGLVTVAVPRSQQPIVAAGMPELMTLPISETSTGAPTEAAFEELAEEFERADSLVIGSGMKPEPESAKLLLRILREVGKPIVADGGVFAALRGNTQLLKSRDALTILTPHTGEFGKMIGQDREKVESHRLNFACEFAQEHRVTLCMKGAPTYTMGSAGDVYINPTGNSGMATAGSGDVLAGLIAGLVAGHDLAPQDVAWISVYLHGLAGDFAKASMTSIAMTAKDIIRHLPAAYQAAGLS